MPSFTLHETLQKDCFVVGDFPLSQLLLSNESSYPWFILVPRVSDVQEIYHLSLSQQQQLWTESRQLSEWLMQHYQGDKLNIATIGNIVPQLHFHHIVRFRSDRAWPKPVWGAFQSVPYATHIAQQSIQAARYYLRLN